MENDGSTKKVKGFFPSPRKSDKKKKSSICRFECDKVSDYRTLIQTL